MRIDSIIERMDRTHHALVGLLAGPVSEDDARWKPPSGAWSILEIVNHLADEESEDFRTRLRMTLEDPSRPWPGIDPERAAADRCYNDRDLPESLDRFARERAESIQWLRSLEAPDWNRTHHHPSIGPLAAGDLIASWAAHDQLHIRQIAKRLFELTQRDAPGFSTAYAGSW